MNRFENWFCGTSFWRKITRKRLLPWLMADVELGEHVLELGAGLGATTGELAKLAPRVTSLEYDHTFAANLARRLQGSHAAVVQGDAACLPFPDKSFSSVTALVVLHHLRSREAQESAFREVARVLKPGGVLVAFEIEDGWLQRVVHFHSTFVPVAPATLPSRLQQAGFATCEIRLGNGGFRLKAMKA